MLPIPRYGNKGVREIEGSIWAQIKDARWYHGGDHSEMMSAWYSTIPQGCQPCTWEQVNHIKLLPSLRRQWFIWLEQMHILHRDLLFPPACLWSVPPSKSLKSIWSTERIIHYTLSEQRTHFAAEEVGSRRITVRSTGPITNLTNQKLVAWHSNRMVCWWHSWETNSKVKLWTWGAILQDSWYTVNSGHNMMPCPSR